MDNDGRDSMRIETADGQALHLHRDPMPGLTCLDLESAAGELVASRVLDAEDLGRVGDTLRSALQDAQAADVPVVVDVSAVLGKGIALRPPPANRSDGRACKIVGMQLRGRTDVEVAQLGRSSTAWWPKPPRA